MEKMPIYLKFAQEKTALQAFDTLQELEYNVELLEHDREEDLPTLLLNINNTDLTSALEIVQAHGGWLAAGGDNELGDPSDGDYDHFPAGVRL